MPTYDYVCESCEHEFEHFQSMSSKPLKKCPACGKLRLKRLIGTGAGIIFKGSGFYETDYRSSDYKQKAKQETDGGSSKSSGEASSSDSGAKTEGKSSGETKKKDGDSSASTPGNQSKASSSE